MENFKGEGRLEPGVVKLIVMMGQTHSLAGKTKRAYRIFVWESTIYIATAWYAK
jgi:hypothetical protein